MNSNRFPKSQVIYLEITAEQVGRRIDNFLHTYFKDVPKNHLYRILRTGEIRVNKGRIKPTYRLQLGDQLRLPPIVSQTEKTLINPQSTALQKLTQSILYEDNYLLIINKPAGMAVHGGSGIH
ncbi:MAG: S4 domain-containing protein, partial [Pseudomonadota bacterium]|nr:S4 domain-containing protein [Pseudomonadota bacterium]